MENGNAQKERPRRSTLAEEIEKLALSKIPVEIAYKDMTNVWEARIGGDCALVDTFNSQWDIVPWLRKTAEMMYPNSQYSRDNREYRRKNHQHKNNQNVNKNNNNRRSH